MLSYFRLNDPYRLLGLLLVLLIIYVPFLTGSLPITYPELKAIIIGEKLRDGALPYAGIIDDSAPFAVYLHGAAHFLFGDSIMGRHIFAALLIFVQAVFIGVIFIDKKIYPESSFVPSMIFGLLFCLSFDNFALSGELIGMFFLLLSLNSLYKELEFREDTLEMVLRTGVYIGIASLFSFSFSIYLVGCFVILFLYSRGSGRKFALMLGGFMLPHLLMIAAYSVSGHASELWSYFYLPNLSFSSMRYIPVGAWLKLIYLPAAFLLIAMVFLNRESRFTKYQSQVLQAMFFWTLFSFIQVVFAKEFRPQSLIPLIIPFTFFISHFFLLIRRRMIAELAFWVLLAGSLAVGLLERYRTAESETYSRLITTQANHSVSNKKILCLSDDLGYYDGNRMSTPFVNWNLSKDIFEHPEYYENVILVYEAFRRDPPEVIVDPQNLMQPFLDKIPEIKSRYVNDEIGYRSRN